MASLARSNDVTLIALESSGTHSMVGIQHEAFLIKCVCRLTNLRRWCRGIVTRFAEGIELRVGQFYSTLSIRFSSQKKDFFFCSASHKIRHPSRHGHIK